MFHLESLAALAALVLVMAASTPVSTRTSHPTAQGEPAAPAPWIQRSNQYAQALLRVVAAYAPEFASKFGVTGFDDRVTDLRPGFNERMKADVQKAADVLRQNLGAEKDPLVRQDLEIMIDAASRMIGRTDLEEKYLVPLIDVPQTVFFGIRTLLDEQVAPERRASALVRLHRYAGTEPGEQPIAVLAENYVRERLKQPSLLGPFKGEIEKNLAQSQYFVDGVDKLFAKFEVRGYEADFAALKAQLAAYGAFVRSEILPRARADFRLPQPIYAVMLRDVGIDASPGDLASMGHSAFNEIQKEMQSLAATIAKQKGMQASDYRDVIRALKKDQVEGDAIMALYKKRIAAIERIIREHHLVTLPDRPMIFRFASKAESAATPAPHMDMPQLLNNTGQKGAFVLPLEIPPAPGQSGEQKFDDFTFDAASWTLTAHEGRPGHELQFDTMVERGVSTARAVFAMNSTNAEGWGLYSEWLLYPYMPDEGKLISLQHRLMRAARAFLDPELQTGKTTPEQARLVLKRDVVLSDALANEEVERYTFWAPGQAPSYYYGFSKLLAVRQEVERALGSRFNQQQFHDFILDQGLLPPPLLKKAVEERFLRKQ